MTGNSLGSTSSRNRNSSSYPSSRLPANPDAMIDAPGPGEGTAIAADTPPVTVLEEVTAYNEEQAKDRARRRRVFQLAMTALAG